jgi:ubiquinone/menaquinone biosynthesis C-methylase UbiE
MSFEDESFDFIWTWGVIHHSSNTQRVLGEMRRVLRRGGRVVTMVYHRNWWNYYVCCGVLKGIFRGELLKDKSIHKIMQRWTDGALARFYTIGEWKSLVSDFFSIEELKIFGSKAEVIPLPGVRIKRFLLSCIPNSFSRLLTNSFKMGTFLVSILKK